MNFIESLVRVLECSLCTVAISQSANDTRMWSRNATREPFKSQRATLIRGTIIIIVITVLIMMIVHN